MRLGRFAIINVVTLWAGTMDQPWSGCDLQLCRGQRLMSHAMQLVSSSRKSVPRMRTPP